MRNVLIKFLSQILRNIFSSLDNFSSFIEEVGYELNIVNYVNSALLNCVFVIPSSDDTIYLPNCAPAVCVFGKAVNLSSDVIVLSPTLVNVVEDHLNFFIKNFGYVPDTYFTEVVKVKDMVEIRYHPFIFRLWSLQLFLETVIVHELTHSALYTYFNTYCPSEATPELYSLLWNAYRTRNLIHAILKIFKYIDEFCVKNYVYEICEEIPRALRALLDVSYLLGLVQDRCFCEVSKGVRRIKLSPDLVIEYVSRHLYTYKFNGVELIKY